MDFSAFEKSVYGDVEDDEDLLRELMALEAEENQKRMPPPKPVPKAAPPPPSVPQRAKVAGVDPRELERALADSFEPDVIIDDNDEDALRELSELLGEADNSSDAPPVPVRAAPPIPTRQPATGNTPINKPEPQNDMLSYLTQLYAEYDKMKKKSESEGNGVKSRRYQRTLQSLTSLMAKAKRGGTIDPNDLPPAPPSCQHLQIPTNGPSVSKTTTVDISQITKTLERRKKAYLVNAQAASEVDDKKSATQFVQIAKQFDQALRSISTANPSELNLDDAPPSPPPYVAPRMEKSSPPQPPSHASKETGEMTRSEAPNNPPPLPQRQLVPPSSNKKEEVKRVLMERRNAYIANAKAASAAQDKVATKGYIDVSKQFDEALSVIDSADIEDIDLNDIPPMPVPYTPKEPDTPPKTFIEGLEQRKQRFVRMAEKAKADGNSSKIRMYNRTVSSYTEAINKAKAGRPVDMSELQSFADMPPIPPQFLGSQPASQPRQPSPSQPQKTRSPPSVGPLSASEVAGEARNTTQLQFLIQRQALFKQAAINAKKHGNNELARKYLLDSKGFDKMISAAKAGLPVNIKDAPVPPQLVTSQSALKPKIVCDSTSSTGVEGRNEVLATLEKTLIDQIQLAENNRMRFTRLGDVGKVRLFESWAKTTQTDLLVVREVAKQGLKLPRYHYETRAIPSADLFPDLAEDVLELSIVSAKDVPLPSGYEVSHANIFARFTFPYPDGNQTGKTKTLSCNTSPVFDDVAILQIGDKKSRGQKLMRILKRTPIKFEVFQKGSFLRSDKLLGTAEWKVDALEGKAEMEESLPLKDGRKAVGGLITLKVRIREPLGDTKLTNLTQKWLILDN